MANRFKTDRFIIETAGATFLRASLAPGVPALLKIKNIRWVGGTTAGHQCIIRDAGGETYWESVASGPNYVESDLEDRLWQEDFAVTTLASGTLYIYLEAGA